MRNVKPLNLVGHDLKKATSRNLSIKILSKTSEIRVFIYKLGIYNLHTKVVSFFEQEKLLKKAMFSLALFRNAYTKNSKIKHCSCSRYIVT